MIDQEIIMSELQEFSEQEELDYLASLHDVKAAIARYGIDILVDACLSDNYESELTNFIVPDTMYVQ